MVLLLTYVSALHAQAPQLQKVSLALTPAVLNFGAQAVNSASAPAKILVSNPSSSPVRITQVLASGIDFALTDKCGKELLPGSRCSVEVVFRPAEPGERLGVVEIVSSDPASPHYVPLSGTGTQ